MFGLGAIKRVDYDLAWVGKFRISKNLHICAERFHMQMDIWIRIML